MTDKRFKFICDDEKCFFKDGNKALYCYEVVDLLNSLSDENEQLKSSLSVYMVDLNNYKNKCSALEKENEELKKDLEHCANMFTDDGKNVLLNLR